MPDTTDSRWPDFPEPLRGLFEGLWQESASLHAKWELYSDLFGDANNLDVLNDTVPAVFQLVEETLRTDMTVSFGRLTDPPKSLSKENLSLSRMIEALREHCEESFVTTLVRKYKELKTHCEPITAWRNRRVAHNDLATALDYHTEPLPGIGRSHITDGLEMIASLMNAIQRHFQDGETCFTHGIQCGTGKDLVFLLRQALEYDDRK